MIAVAWLASAFVDARCHIGTWDRTDPDNVYCENGFGIWLDPGVLWIHGNGNIQRHYSFEGRWVGWRNRPVWTFAAWPYVGGVSYYQDDHALLDPAVEWEVTLPYWLLLTGAAIPTTWLWRRRRRRYSPGKCRECGYNLTGNTSGRCPECGTPIEAATAEGR
jgi:hypothetical protein